MIIRPNKILTIKNNFIEFSFNDDIENGEETIPDFKKFNSLNSAEQYFLADKYNWDDGPIVLKWIIESTKCDEGTACLIFWRAEPDYYFKYSNETIDDYEKDIWELLQLIVKRFRANNFSTSNFEFIPSKEGYKTDWPIEMDIWKLPESLKTGVYGKKPFTYGL